jgi:hypothetical protein
LQKLRFFSAIPIIAFILLAGLLVKADTAALFEEAAKLLPGQIGNFKAISQVHGVDDDGDFFNGTINVTCDYQSTNGERLTVLLNKHASDSGAYARTVYTTKPFKNSSSGHELKTVDIGTLGYAASDDVFFYKGSVYVDIRPHGRLAHQETLLEFARQFADTLDKGDGEIPALVKHLPGWESGTVDPAYAVNLFGLKENLPNQPVFDAINFVGGVEAVSANYGAAKLVIVEFNTPQLATENDRAIVSKIPELHSQAQPAPSAYRRVGNYAVFVFDAPTPEAANQLIDQVKYQQVVQWLGENPFSYERATREFTETTLGVFVSVVKASGLALVTCLAVGGFFGALLFRVRRAQQRAREAYSDSDAMLRLNLDELTPESDPGRLLHRGN